MKKQLERHGLDGGLLLISDGALWKIIRGYTKEAGVRTLERRIGELCRKAAREILESGKIRCDQIFLYLFNIPDTIMVFAVYDL